MGFSHFSLSVTDKAESLGASLQLCYKTDGDPVITALPIAVD
jgi:hypothetical protein